MLVMKKRSDLFVVHTSFKFQLNNIVIINFKAKVQFMSRFPNINPYYYPLHPWFPYHYPQYLNNGNITNQLNFRYLEPINFPYVNQMSFNQPINYNQAPSIQLSHHDRFASQIVPLLSANSKQTDREEMSKDINNQKKKQKKQKKQAIFIDLCSNSQENIMEQSKSKSNLSSKQVIINSVPLKEQVKNKQILQQKTRISECKIGKYLNNSAIERKGSEQTIKKHKKITKKSKQQSEQYIEKYVQSYYSKREIKPKIYDVELRSHQLNAYRSLQKKIRIGKQYQAKIPEFIVDINQFLKDKKKKIYDLQSRKIETI